KQGQVRKPHLSTDIERGFGLLQNHVLTPEEKASQRVRGAQGSNALLAPIDWSDGAWKPIKAFLTRPELKLIHAIRFLYLVGMIDPTRERADWMLGWKFGELLDHYRKSHAPFDLRELAAAFTTFGMDSRAVGERRLGYSWGTPSFHWEESAIWPYFSENLDLLTAAFQPKADYMSRYHRKNAFEVLRLF